MTCTATGTAERGLYENRARPPARHRTAPVTDTDPSHYFGADPQIHIEKATNGQDADDPPGPPIVVGGDVTWTYVVTNPGNVPITDVAVTDDHAGVNPTFQGGDANGNNRLDPGETWTYEATGTATGGQYENTGTVTGTDALENPVSDTDPSHYFGARAELDDPEVHQRDRRRRRPRAPDPRRRPGDLDLRGHQPRQRADRRRRRRPTTRPG